MNKGRSKRIQHFPKDRGVSTVESDKNYRGNKS